MKTINIVTAFPDYVKSFLNFSIIKRAIEKDCVKINIYNLRDYSTYNNRQIDDYVYGGDPGMLLMVEPIHNAIININKKFKNNYIVILCPKGKTFNQTIAKKFALPKYETLTFICGHYEGFDARVYKYVNESISLGNFITTSGESIVSVILDSIIRLIPNVISKKSLENESFNDSDKMVEYDQYTRPQTYDNVSVPNVLVNGNHKEIDKWKKQSLLKNNK